MHDMVSSKQLVADEVCALNRWYGMGPVCDSLDHRARACYLPCSLSYDELRHTVSMHSLLVPPSTF